MKTREFKVNGRRIRLEASAWTGKEIVYYEGKVVSEKRDFTSYSVHTFEAREAGEDVVYEVNFFHNNWGLPGYVVRRNGIAVSHDP